MKFTHFACHLGVFLSLAGAGDCARRYIAIEQIIPIYESARTPEASIKRYEELVKDLPQGKHLASIYRSQEGSVEAFRSGHVELLQTLQESLRNQGILFGFLFMLFGVLWLRVSGSNKALQDDVPRPAGSGRA